MHILKGTVHKQKSCHRLLTLTDLKEDILKDVVIVFVHTIKDSGVQNNIDFHYFFQRSSFVFDRRK